MGQDGVVVQLRIIFKFYSKIFVDRRERLPPLIVVNKALVDCLLFCFLLCDVSAGVCHVDV